MPGVLLGTRDIPIELNGYTLLDLFLVGSNTVANADKIIEHICRAFAEVAPTVSSNNTAAATSPTALDILTNAADATTSAP